MKIKRFAAALAAALCLLALCPRADANAPAPPSYCYGTVTNAPPGAIFVDLLIQIAPDSEGYTPYNADTGQKTGISQGAEIVAYQAGGYRSLSFHYDAVSAYPELTNSYFIMDETNQSLDKLTASVKVALLDRDGGIVAISDAADVAPPDRDSFARGFSYDAAANTIEVQFSPFYKGSSVLLVLLLFVGVILLRVALSVGVEVWIAVPFGLKPLRRVFLVNLVTQIVLTVFLRTVHLRYLHAVIVGELLVYLVEGAVYLHLFRTVDRRKVIVYTVVANTVSLALGLALNAFGLLMW